MDAGTNTFVGQQESEWKRERFSAVQWPSLVDLWLTLNRLPEQKNLLLNSQLQAGRIRFIKPISIFVWMLECKLWTCHTPVKVMWRRWPSGSGRMLLASLQVTFVSRLAVQGPGCVCKALGPALQCSPVANRDDRSSLNSKYNLPDCWGNPADDLSLTQDLLTKGDHTDQDIYRVLTRNLDWKSTCLCHDATETSISNSCSHVQSHSCSIFNDWLNCGRAKGCNINYISTHWENSSTLLSRRTTSK